MKLEVETKYGFGEVVWAMVDNKPIELKVMSVSAKFEGPTLHSRFPYYTLVRAADLPPYRDCDYTTLSQSRLFPSKQSLLDSFK